MSDRAQPDRGDVMLVRFVFADEQGAKRRPVLVLSGGAWLAGRQEVVVAAMTSNTERLLPGDRMLRHWQAAGLPQPTVVTGILRTVKRDMLERRFGSIHAQDWAAVREELGLMLDGA